MRGTPAAANPPAEPKAAERQAEPVTPAGHSAPPTEAVMPSPASPPRPTRQVAPGDRELRLARNVLDGLREIARNLGVFYDDDGDSVPFEAIVEASRRVSSGALTPDDLRLRRVLVAAGFDASAGPVLLEDVVARIAGETARGLAKRDASALEDARAALEVATSRIAEVLERAPKKEAEPEAEVEEAAAAAPAPIDRGELERVADELLMTLTGRAGRELVARRKPEASPIVDEARKLDQTLARFRRASA